MEWHDRCVLIVEDEADSLELLETILKHQGIVSTGAQTAEEALAILDDVDPSLIIVDLALPGMDGWGLLQRLQANPSLKDVPKVAVTAYHTPILAAKAITAGFDAFFPKPIDAGSFIDDLNMIVAEKRS